MKVFITGATGYIGGSVAQRLVREGHAVRGLGRDATKAIALSARGIEPVLGSLEDASILSEEVARADAIVNAASSDHRDSVETMLMVLRGTGKAFVHTSGTGKIGDDACGERLSSQIYDDESAVVPGPHPFAQARHALDMRILDAATSGVRAIVLCNPLIYGIGSGLDDESIQIPMLAKQAVESGVIRVIGHGLNHWSNVHVEDMATLYSLALLNAPAGAFYFVENGEASFAEIGAAIAFRLGLGSVQFWSVDEARACWGDRFPRSGLGSNSRVRGLRARRELGWTPSGPPLTDWIKTELPTR